MGGVKARLMRELRLAQAPVVQPAYKVHTGPSSRQGGHHMRPALQAMIDVRRASARANLPDMHAF